MNLIYNAGLLASQGINLTSMSTTTHSNPTSIHGVFMSIFNTGTLLQGASGCGKSQLALSLLQHGHQLIADDIVDVTQLDQHLVGTCPPLLQNYLAPRCLGMINVAKIFGPHSVCQEHRLELVITLRDPAPQDELQSCWKQDSLLGCSVTALSLPADNPHLIALTETAVRAYAFAKIGDNHTDQFIQRHHRALQSQERGALT